MNKVRFLNVLRHEEKSLGEARDGTCELLVHVFFVLIVVHELVAAHGDALLIEILAEELLLAEVAIVVGSHGGRE